MIFVLSEVLLQIDDGDYTWQDRFLSHVVVWMQEMQIKYSDAVLRGYFGFHMLFHAVRDSGAFLLHCI